MLPRANRTQYYTCPCGYSYEPAQGDEDAGYTPGTAFEKLPDALTCPRCRRAKVHFREKWRTGASDK